MNFKIILPALAWAASACFIIAQDGPPPPPGDGPPPPSPQEQGPRVHVLPRHADEALRLTAEQQKQVADLEAEVKAKLLKILTSEQAEKLDQMRPPQPENERGARGRRGEGAEQGAQGPGPDKSGRGSEQGPPPPPRPGKFQGPPTDGPGTGDESGPPRSRRTRDGADQGPPPQDGQGPRPEGRGPRDRQGPPPPPQDGPQRPPTDRADATPGGASSAAAPLAPGVTRTPVTLTGGFETNPVDHGRPVVLVAGALGVAPEVFREAFSGVHPADQNVGPTGEEARKNKAALMSVLGKYGITNDQLDAASNQYRYVRSRGELWRHATASVNALVKDGVVVGFEIVNAGAGYSSPPQISVAGMPNVRGAVKLVFDKDFAKNGSIQEVTLEGGR